MESKIRILLLIGMAIITVSAEPPRFRSSFRVRNSRLRFAKQELPPPPEETNGATPAESEVEPAAPYPPSGWKPSGRSFPLPTEKEAEPDTHYGAPERTTSPPDKAYGPPDNTYGPPAQEMTTEQPLAPYPPSQSPNAPYPPSGWKPRGRAFPLPTEKEAEPDQKYGPPTNTYGPPDNTYGPPESELTTTVIPGTEDDTVIVDAPIEGQPEAFFYIRLPNGTIQKVSFSPTKPAEQFRSARLRQNSRNEFRSLSKIK